MRSGYQGKVLHVDLTSGSITEEQIPESFIRKYFGGSALGMYYLFNNTQSHIDPLRPENTLVFAISPLTGTPISGQSRMTVTAKSPLTNCAGDSNCGGNFPATLKFAGFDAIVFAGRSKQPVYLWIHEGLAELRPANHLWGKLTNEVDAGLRAELGGGRIEIAQCGLAGEKLVRFAGIINNLNRANGRNGMGAVMASKNLKAIVVRGKKKPYIADPVRLRELAKWGRDNFEDSGAYSLGVFGTSGIVEDQNSDGGLPTRNWSSGTFEGWESIDGHKMAKTMLKKRDSCYACTIRCKRVVEVKEGIFPVDPQYGGPEYETVSALGSYCGISDLSAIAHANQLCNMYGLDTISCGATIAWAMDCYERGFLTNKDTGGIELKFGNAEALVELVKLIAKRQGIGDLLAEGSARAAAKIKNGSEDLVVAVKNQEYPAHMPQVKRSLALIYAVNPFGADHQSHEHDMGYLDYKEKAAQLGLTNPQPMDVLNEEKIRYAFYTQCLYSLLESADLCEFVYGAGWQLYGPGQIVQVIQAITGWQVSLAELLQVGERRLNLMRSFNAREGLGREADTLPLKIQKALTGGKSHGVLVTRDEIEQAKDCYYAMAGWDVELGKPTRKKLRELDLDWVADKLEL